MYTEKGKCIWCGKSEPEVHFETAPHILPRKLGGREIGFDVCDDCNHYFGTASLGKPNIDLVIKEIFNAYRFFGQNLNENSYKKYHSAFFSYWHKTHSIRLKKEFRADIITVQFKRALYSVFLQKYHELTCNGNHPMFDAVRKFARYNIGDLHVFYVFNNVLLVPDDKEMESPRLIINDKLIDDMMNYGIFNFWLMGEIFYLEILPIAFQAKGMQYLREQAKRVLIPAEGNEKIFELTDVMQLDFFLQRFNSKR